MEENKLEIIKPQFDGEIIAKIKSVGEIESNMKEVKGYVENLNNYYKNVTFTEDTIKEAKEEKAKVNKFKTQVADYRKKIVDEYNKPIELFQNTAKETEKMLTETYNTINQQVANYDNIQKEKKEQEVKDYFEEYKTSLNIDFIIYEQAKINVTLTASMKSLKEQAKAFIDRVNSDLATIALQEHKDEILVEYKQNGFTLNKAMETVLTRIKAVEDEKKKQEEIINNNLKEEQKRMTVALDNLKNNNKEDVTLQAPVEEKQEEILTLKLSYVKGTRRMLKAFKQFLDDGGYEYE